MKRETDKSSKERLQVVERKLAELKEKSSGLRARWQKERDAIARLSALKKQIEALRLDLEEQTRRGNLERAGADSIWRAAQAGS